MNKTLLKVLASAVMAESCMPAGTGMNATCIQPEKVNRKQQRNEGCSCGSGLKYKKCHGRYS